MPDGDYLSRQIRPRWRSAFNLIRGTHESAFVAWQVDSSAAAFIRETGGFTALDAALAIVDDARAGRITMNSAFDRARAFELGSGNCDVFLPNVIRRFLAIPTTEMISRAALATGLVREIMANCVFGPTRMLAQEIAAENPGLSPEYLDRCEADTAKLASKLGASLARDPSAKTLRAPAYPGRRQSTEELMAEAMT